MYFESSVFFCGWLSESIDALTQEACELLVNLMHGSYSSPSFIGSGVGGVAPLCLSNWNMTTLEDGRRTKGGLPGTNCVLVRPSTVTAAIMSWCMIFVTVTSNSCFAVNGLAAYVLCRPATVVIVVTNTIVAAIKATVITAFAQYICFQ